MSPSRVILIVAPYRLMVSVFTFFTCLETHTLHLHELKRLVHGYIFQARQKSHLPSVSLNVSFPLLHLRKWVNDESVFTFSTYARTHTNCCILLTISIVAPAWVNVRQWLPFQHMPKHAYKQSIFVFNVCLPFPHLPIVAFYFVMHTLYFCSFQVIITAFVPI